MRRVIPLASAPTVMAANRWVLPYVLTAVLKHLHQPGHLSVGRPIGASNGPDDFFALEPLTLLSSVPLEEAEICFQTCCPPELGHHSVRINLATGLTTLQTLRHGTSQTMRQHISRMESVPGRFTTQHLAIPLMASAILWRICASRFSRFAYKKNFLAPRGKQSIDGLTQIRAVPASVWKLVAVAAEKGQDSLYVDWENGSVGDGNGTAWRDVEVIYDPPEPRASDVAALQAELCQILLTPLMERFPPKTFDQTLTVFRGLFEGLSRDNFRSAWNIALAEARKNNPATEWGRDGRPRTSESH